MVKIILEPARNGVIKKVIDDNHGGGKEKYQSVDVYENNDPDLPYDYIIRFFYELCEDLNLTTGSKFDEKVLKLDVVWGSHFNANVNDIDKKIAALKAEIELLEQWKITPSS
jgi:hypothetical protein